MKKLVTVFLFIGIFSSFAVAEQLNIQGFFLGMTQEQCIDAAEKLGYHAYQHDQKFYSISNISRIIFFNGKYIKLFHYNTKNLYFTAKERTAIEHLKIGEQIDSVLNELVNVDLKPQLEISIKKMVVAKEQIISGYGVKYLDNIAQAVFTNNKLEMIQFAGNLSRFIFGECCEKKEFIKAFIDFYNIPHLEKIKNKVLRRFVWNQFISDNLLCKVTSRGFTPKIADCTPFIFVLC